MDKSDADEVGELLVRNGFARKEDPDAGSGFILKPDERGENLLLTFRWSTESIQRAPLTAGAASAYQATLYSKFLTEKGFATSLEGSTVVISGRVALQHC